MLNPGREASCPGANGDTKRVVKPFALEVFGELWLKLHEEHWRRSLQIVSEASLPLRRMLRKAIYIPEGMRSGREERPLHSRSKVQHGEAGPRRSREAGRAPGRSFAGRNSGLVLQEQYGVSFEDAPYRMALPGLRLHSEASR